jgi:hypothetical protein
MQRALKVGRVRTRDGELAPAKAGYVRALKKVRGKRIGAGRPSDMCSDGGCENPLMAHGQPARKDMPQVDTWAALRRADSILPARRRYENVPVQKLRYSQREINRTTVEGIMGSMRKTRRKTTRRKKNAVPIVVFEHPKGTLTVGDGHHRVAALKELVRRGELPKRTTARARVYTMDPEVGLLTLNSTGFDKGHKF